MRVRGFISVLLIAIVAGGSGCGKETVSIDTAHRAAEASSRAGSFKTSMEVVVDHEELDEPMVMKSSGEMDMKRGRGRMVQDLGAVAEQIGGPDELKDLKMQVVFADLAMYAEMPDLPAGDDSDPSHGKPWIKVDLRRATRDIGFDLDQLMQAGNSPQSMLDQLKAVTGELEKVGTEEVRGVETTHYKGTADLRKLAEAAPPEVREATRRMTDKMVADLGGPTYPIELWIDGDNLLRRDRHVSSKSEPGLPGKLKATVTSEYFDYGTEVDVETPPEEDVHDMTAEIADELKTP